MLPLTTEQYNYLKEYQVDDLSSSYETPLELYFQLEKRGLLVPISNCNCVGCFLDPDKFCLGFIAWDRSCNTNKGNNQKTWEEDS